MLNRRFFSFQHQGNRGLKREKDLYQVATILSQSRVHRLPRIVVLAENRTPHPSSLSTTKIETKEVHQMKKMRDLLNEETRHRLIRVVAVVTTKIKMLDDEFLNETIGR